MTPIIIHVKPADMNRAPPSGHAESARPHPNVSCWPDRAESPRGFRRRCVTGRDAHHASRPASAQPGLRPTFLTAPARTSGGGPRPAKVWVRFRRSADRLLLPGVSGPGWVMPRRDSPAAGGAGERGSSLLDAAGRDRGRPHRPDVLVLSLLRSLIRRPRSALLSSERAGGGRGPWRVLPGRGPCPRRTAPGCPTP